MQLLIALFLIFSSIPNVSAFYQEPLLQSRQSEQQSKCVLLHQVTLVYEDTESMFHTCANSVSEFLEERGIDLSMVEYTESKLWTGKKIFAIPVERSRKLVWQSIPYATEETYDTSITHKKRVYTQKGVKGTRGIVIETTVYPDGKKKEKVVKKWVEKEPVKEVVTIGTQYEMQKETVEGKTIWYWKKLTVVATSYDKNCEGCNDTTATGAKLTKGIVAVDPKVIPLHTKMYIPGYGFGQAEDVGGAIKGNKIDLGFDDLRYGNWSKRSVTIYIID